MPPSPLIASNTPALAALPATWRVRAAEFRGWGAELHALVHERLAEELEAALRTGADDALTLEQAAKESDYSVDHLRHLVANGTIPNAGRKHAPRIRRRDLPKRPGTGARSDYDPAADALRLVGGTP